MKGGVELDIRELIGEATDYDKKLKDVIISFLTF